MYPVNRTISPNYSLFLPKGKGKFIGKTYCPTCSQGKYETEIEKRYIMGIIPIKIKCEFYKRGEDTEHFRYKNGYYCGKCKNLNGHYLNLK